MSQSKIEWTEKTWNPVTGCDKISSGCSHCYAESMAKRLKSMGVKKYENGFSLTLHPESLGEPLKWTRSSYVFICSMGDLFHDEVPFDFIDRVFETINATPQHTYQILTKRPQNMQEYFARREVPRNVWLGVTIEDKSNAFRIDYLRKIRANVRFLSCEPLLEDICDLDFAGTDWIIVGGESGMKARPLKYEWVVSLRNVAKKNRIPFFFKQWGTWGADGIKRSKKENGNLLDGKRIMEYPKKCK